MLTSQAYVDESARGSSYYVCVAVIADGDVNDLRRLARSFCLAGQRRWHFVHERDSRRRQILDKIVNATGVSALVYFGNGNDGDIRAESFRRMVQQLLDRRVTRLIIESREGRDEFDRRVLVEQLHQHGGTGFSYTHLPAHSDPLLWVADALAWSFSAGGAWRKRIAPIVSDYAVTNVHGQYT